MTKKRRMFDIDLPDDDVPAPETKSLGGLRRGPMATARPPAGATTDAA